MALARGLAYLLATARRCCRGGGNVLNPVQLNGALFCCALLPRFISALQRKMKSMQCLLRCHCATWDTMAGGTRHKAIRLSHTIVLRFYIQIGLSPSFSVGLQHEISAKLWGSRFFSCHPSPLSTVAH